MGPEPAEDLRAAGRHVVTLVAAIGLLSVVAYGVVQARARSQSERSWPTATTDEVARAAALDALSVRVATASRVLDVEDLRALEEALAHTADDTLAPAVALEARLVRAESLATRTLEAALRSRVEIAAEPGVEVQTLVSTSEAALDELARGGASPVRIAAARLRVRLAAGDDLVEVAPHVLMPSHRDPELRLAVLARPVWFDASAAADVAGEILDELRRAPPTGLTRALVAITAWRLGDPEVARGEIQALVVAAPEQPLARALEARLEQPVEVIEPEAKAPVRSPPPAPSGDAKATEGERPREPEVDATALVEQGCDAVHDGKASQGLVLLRRAFDLQPGGVKVTLCLAEAHDQLGNAPSARAFVDRVLRRTPNDLRARLLAAKLEHARGNTAAALAHYEKVLAIEPGHAAAKAYVAEHGGG